MKGKKILLTTILTIIVLCMLSTLCNAVVLQGTTKNRAGTEIASRSAAATDWVINIRKMESKDGGMGLNETINEENALSTSGSNGIDVHMQKNTEYGAAILLGASDYGKIGTVGKPGTDANTWMNGGTGVLTGTTIKASTTGNVTGIFELSNENGEWTAGGLESYLSNISPKYRDIYTEEKVGKLGDATYENGINLGTWHGSTPAEWVSSSRPGFLRGHKYYHNYNGKQFVGAFEFTNNPINSTSQKSRACVVSAKGI